ncbi:cellulose binding domain-containing protein [Sorangium sp. So ce1014]|uniref:cellulose binding domain-containing protein n=1 Tax=Sorangium sp. So ce1014 TaxID=3133326 RepID=UPI003F618AA5
MACAEGSSLGGDGGGGGSSATSSSSAAASSSSTSVGSAGSTTSIAATGGTTSSTTGVGGDGGAGGLGGAGGDGGADVTSSTASSSASTTASSSASSTASSSASTTASSSASTTASSSASTTASSSASTTASSTTGVGGGSATSSTTASSSTGGVTTPALELQYAARATAAESSELSFQVRVKNTGDESIALSDLTIRYWFTADVTVVDLKSDCDFALTTSICANVVTWTFEEASGTDADHYLELGFLAAAGSIPPGATTGPVQIRIHNRDVYDRMTQTDDYSFEATTAWIPSTQITVYRDGVLAWGTEP